MRILQISDTHLSLAQPLRAASLDACIDHINGLEQQPDLVIHTGDVVHDGTVDEYAVARKIMGKLKAPLYLIPGNRDHRERLIETSAALSPARLETPYVQYTITADGLRLICLDTLVTGTNKGQLCAERMEHLRLMLDQDRETPCAVFMHHPPFEVPTSKFPFAFEPWDNAGQVMDLLKNAGNVTGIFAGHVHRPFSRMIGKMMASTMTAIALDLRVGDDPPGTDMRPRCMIHEFEGCNGFSSQSIMVPQTESVA